MMDYPELYRRLAQEILKQEGNIGDDTVAFTANFVKRLRAQGYKLEGDAEALLNTHLMAMETALKSAVTSAIAIGFAAPSLQSEIVLEAAEQAFIERWPDGLALSDRLWRWRQSARDGVQAQLQAGIRQGHAIDKIMYAMQRAIEKDAGQRFKIVSDHADDWVEDLHRSAVAMLHDPAAKAGWQKVVDDVEARISGLSRNGSRNAAERLLSQIKKGVKKGNEAVLDSAVKWWVYDQQLHHLKRIARTEMATAAHRAVVSTTIDDPSIIGYQWRLSGSHPVADICDYYADIEMGLGRGVWTKEAVPWHKAHPHCMCLLIPRATPIRQKGGKNYADFIKNTSPERRNQLLPKWVKNASSLGMPLDKLLREDGMGLVARAELKQRLGEEKFNALDALGRALVDKQWPDNKLRLKMPQTRDTLASLQSHGTVPEVFAFLAKMEQSGHKVSSLDWHYFRYKYHFGDDLKTAKDLDRRFDAVLQDKNAVIYKPGERYAVYSAKENRLAFVQGAGLRVSIYQPDPQDLEYLGDPLWHIHTLYD